MRGVSVVKSKILPRYQNSLVSSATQLKLFEHKQSVVYDCDVRKDSFNASLFAPWKSCWGVPSPNPAMSTPRN